MTFRDGVNGLQLLLLSAMGDYLDTPDKAPAVSGSACSSLSSCALSSGGRKSIGCWMRRAIGVQPGKSRVVSGDGKSEPCGIVVATNGCRPVFLGYPSHPQYPKQSMWLVIARRKGGLPWYLLTNKPIRGAENAWGIIFAYARRWQIEIT